MCGEKANYAINPTPEQALRSNRALLPARVIAALGFTMENMRTLEVIKAAFEDDPETINRLASEGVDLKRSEKEGNTPIRTACWRNSVRALEALLKAGVSPNQRMRYISPVDKRVEAEMTPLMYVGSVEAAKILISFGAEVNAADELGTTALMRAAKGGNLEVVRLLLAHGADKTLRQLKVRNRGGYTAEEMAMESLKISGSFPSESITPARKTHNEELEKVVAMLKSGGKT